MCATFVSNITLSNLKFVKNAVPFGFYTSIYVYSSSEIILKDSIFDQNVGSAGNGLTILESAQIDIFNN